MKRHAQILFQIQFKVHILSSFPECSQETAKFPRMHLAMAEAVEKTHIVFEITNKLLIDINYKQVIYISETSGPVFNQASKNYS